MPCPQTIFKLPGLTHAQHTASSYGLATLVWAALVSSATCSCTHQICMQYCMPLLQAHMQSSGGHLHCASPKPLLCIGPHGNPLASVLGAQAKRGSPQRAASQSHCRCLQLPSRRAPSALAAPSTSHCCHARCRSHSSLRCHVPAAVAALKGCVAHAPQEPAAHLRQYTASCAWCGDQ